MLSNYYCKICSHTSTQLSHHKSHLRTMKHKDKKKIFELEIKQLSENELKQEYNSTNINSIIKKMEQEKVMKPKEDNVIEFPKKNILGTILWNLSNNQEKNANYKTIKTVFDSVIKQCHNTLYSRNSIVGQKAQTDIMKILCLKILEKQFSDTNSKLYKKYEQMLADDKVDNDYKKYTIIQEFIKSVKEEEVDIIEEWEEFVGSFLSIILPSIYEKKDGKFSFSDANTVISLIEKIDKLKINEEFMDAFSTTCGDIHETFRTYGGGKSAKELGQFFTPRKLIHLMFYGLGLKQLIQKNGDITIYDPCMGTGGFLTRLYKLCNVPSSNIYGCEIEPDTIKFGQMSMYLTTGEIDNNVIKCNSLSENPFIQDKKFTSIVTNPPFGTRMSYKKLKEMYETKFENSSITFKDIYPIKVNNGACLFVQHCVYMLEDNGSCAIVLPDGELFEGNSKWSKRFRKWLCQNVNIRTILKVPGGTFEHAGVKTNVVVFTKDGPTQNIRFLKTTKECNVVKEMFSINETELKAAEYSLDIGEYLEDETLNYNVHMVALGEVCDIDNGFAFKSKDYVNNGHSIFTIKNINKNGSVNLSKTNKIKPNSKFSKYIIHNNDILIALTGATIGKIGLFKSIDDNIYYLNQRVGRFNNITNKIIHKYLLYLLLYSYFKEEIIKLCSSGERGNISTKVILKKIKIPLPSLEVQRQIVDELSSIETSIKAVETRITQLKREKDQYKKYSRKAEIRELIKDSEKVKIKSLFQIIYGNRNPSNKEEGKLFPSISGGSKISKYTDEWNIPKNTILIARSGSCGSINMFNEPCLMGSYGFFLKEKTTNFNKKYVYYYLKFNQKDLVNLSRGTAVKNLNRDKLYDYKISLPSPEIQEQCIKIYQEKETYLQSITQKIETEKKYIKELKELAKDIIHSYC